MKYGVDTTFIIISIDTFSKAHTVIVESKIKNNLDTGRSIPLSVINMHYKRVGKHLFTIFKDL